MKKSLTLLLLLSFSLLASARIMRSWTYQEMYDKADLVVIANPRVTKDTVETNTLPDIRPDIKVVGLSTDFEVNTVMKGDKTNRLVLHHYRLPRRDEQLMNGPYLVSFDPAQHYSYLLFLTRERDGRYAPVTGQTDPGAFSVIKLEGAGR